MENLSLFTNIDSSVKDSKSNSSASSNSEFKKEGSSLFDSLLKENSQKLVSESTITDSNIKQKELLNNNSNSQISKNTLNDNVKGKSVVSEAAPSTDLISKLLVDAKTSLDKTSNGINQDSKIGLTAPLEKATSSDIKENDVSVKLTNTNNLQVNNTTVLKENTQANIISKVKNENIDLIDVKSSDQTTTLLDRLLSNAINSIQKSEINNLEKNNSGLTPKNVINNTQENLDTIVTSNSVVKTKDSIELIVDTNKIEEPKINKVLDISLAKNNSELSTENVVNKNVINNTQENLDTIVTSNSVTKTKAIDKAIDNNLVKNVNLPLLESITEDIEIKDKNQILEKNLQAINVLVDKNKSDTVQITQQIPLKSDNSKTESLVEVLKVPETSVEKLNNEIGTLSEDNIEGKTLNGLESSKLEVSKSSVDEKLNNKVDIQSNELNTSKAIYINDLENIDKNTIVNTEQKIKNISLLDELIKKATISDFAKQNAPVVSENVKDNLLSNIYLGSVKNNITNQNIINTSTARAILQNASSVQDVKKASDILNLNADNISVDTEVKIDTKIDIKQVDFMKIDQKISILDRVLINTQRLENINLLATKITDLVKLDNQIINTSNATSNFNDMINKADEVNLSVNQNLANNIQSRIIGARQQMSSMMSDLARTMYENYKPPVTVFKINLNPANLGMISVVMKNERDNSISISMNMSNDSTLEAILDNQNSLRSALSRTFSEQNNSFNLDFGSNENFQNQNNENEFESDSINRDDNNEDISQNNANIQDNTTYL